MEITTRESDFGKTEQMWFKFLLSEVGTNIMARPKRATAIIFRSISL